MTKINLLFLQAMEVDQFDQLPGGMFPRAMARAYARAIGEPEQPIIEIYDAQFPPPPPPVESRSRNWKPLLRFSASLVLLLLTAAGFLFWKSQDSVQMAQQGLSEAKAAVLSTNGSAVRVSVLSEPQIPATDGRTTGLDLQIVVLEECWLSLSADGNIVDRRLLKKGEAFTYHADNTFEALVGNAGGLKFVINGEVWEKLGNAYDVKRIRIAKDAGKVRLIT